MHNFRQAYYGKLGYKGAEGKLEVLLDEKKVKDLNKLKSFAEEYGVLNSHRLLLWGYLSNLFPVYPNNFKYVVEQRIEQFQDLHKSVYIIKLIDDESAPQDQILYTMWLLETNRLPFGGGGSMRAVLAEEHSFLVITRALTRMFPEQESVHLYQVYWIAKAVYDMATQTFDIDALVAQIYSELEPNLLRDLEQKDILSQLPIATWFKRCFAGVVLESALGRIWDKLFGGAPKILVFVMIKMLQFLRDKLLCDTEVEIQPERLFVIFETNQEAADRVVNKAIESLEGNNKK